MKKTILMIAFAALAVVPGTRSTSASQLVYHPVNPTFGGNPQNGPTLLSQAQAQGEGVKSGSQGPDLSGLNSALSNLGSGAVVIGGTGTSGTGGSGTGSNAATSNRAGTVGAITP
jgi:curli production assembly/transport component CsgF